ncbi:MAG: hypothetical protein ACU4EQ_00355 [Candidatus Nitrosoglobus sp.]|jgi:hypothetical protein
MFKRLKNLTKTNKKYVSSLSEVQLDSLINIVGTIVFTQQQIIVGQNGGSLPESATDEWSIGYVYGVIDTIFQG